MGRMYTVQFENATVPATNAMDLFELAPAANKPIRLHGLWLHQRSDMGDAQEEALRVQIIRGHATSGSGGSSATPVPLNSTDPAAGFAAEVNNTTIASAGTAVNICPFYPNIRVGAEILWPPEIQPMCHNGDGTIVVRLLAGPADALTMCGVLYVEEM